MKDKIIFLLLAANIISFTIALESPKVIAAEPEIITVVREVEIEPPQPIYNITSVERELIARLLYTEARGEPVECQYAIVSVIFNRWYSTGSSITDIIYAEDQFDLASQLYKITPTEKEYDSVDYVVYNGTTIPNWVQYFRASRHHDWDDRYVGYCVIGDTYFGGIKNP